MVRHKRIGSINSKETKKTMETQLLPNSNRWYVRPGLFLDYCTIVGGPEAPVRASKIGHLHRFLLRAHTARRSISSVVLVVWSSCAVRMASLSDVVSRMNPIVFSIRMAFPRLGKPFNSLGNWVNIAIYVSGPCGDRETTITYIGVNNSSGLLNLLLKFVVSVTRYFGRTESDRILV